MTSNKPYFIRALYEWILDNNCTPYIVVDATLPFVEVPEQFITEGKIILNILPSATHDLYLGDDWITFSARFSGISQDVNVPIGAVAAIYAQENGEGMGFQTEALPEDYFTNETVINTPSKTSSPKPLLNVIETKSNPDDHLNVTKTPTDSETSLVLESKKTVKSNSSKKKSKPTFTIIK
ncbi:MAG TPA: ClpXP protease specificity-enhancing factor [Candidatus Ignatzschineria merdigallinarum]|uniref:ClpXP protease specificity-enhancing factor n=1 Tax=Candidatus Ignatzschineria merdigallinarum TaxID=2838621 RepID=A0A9D1Q4I7_9GAMM|nr:ClpXP protease specificity-enhancing factor [Candidatus Ignatzschineria merdigallinarum]